MKNVYSTRKTKRYRFPTHINDLIYDRSEATCSEAFVVVLEPGGAPPLHKHDDTEQVFYVIEGRGALRVGRTARPRAVRAGDVIVIPPRAWHSVRATGGPLRYLAVDCFGAAKDRKEPTWDSHVRVLCREQGWDYAQVVQGSAR
jgi:quercetin dioxygenase-like cupin family protein